MTSVARTAGSFTALRSMGVPAREKDLVRTGSFLARRLDDLPEGHGSSPHGVFFGVIAANLLGNEARGEFEKTIVPRILAAQDVGTGALDCICRHTSATTCESFKSEENNFTLRMMGGENLGWVRRTSPRSTSCAALREGQVELLDGIPADDGKAAPETTPGGMDAPPSAPPDANPAPVPVPAPAPPPALPPTPTGPSFK